MTAVVETEIVLSDQMSPQKQYRCIAGAGNRATEKRRRRPLPIRPVSAISSLLLVVALLLGPLPDVVRITSVSAAASGSGMGSGIAPTVPGVLPVAAGQNELPEKEVLPLEVLAEDGEEWRQELPDELQKRAGTLVRISLSGDGGDFVEDVGYLPPCGQPPGPHSRARVTGTPYAPERERSAV